MKSSRSEISSPFQTIVPGYSNDLALWADLRPVFIERMRRHQLDVDLAERLIAVYLPLSTWVAAQTAAQPLVLGISGAQGAGKSTLSDFLKLLLESVHGLKVAAFSLDDLYKTRAERSRLAREVHPLLVTRGVPGTHDPDLGLDTLNALCTAGPYTLTAIPSFDKAADDRKPVPEWLTLRGQPDIILLEGWCLGAIPQTEEALQEPINDLERNEDADGTFRRYVNEQLRGDYARLFARLDRLIMLKVPGMDCVFEWRALQEQKLADSLEKTGRHRLMNATELRRFIMHYERLTRHILAEMPGRADLVLHFNEQHQLTQIDPK